MAPSRSTFLKTCRLSQFSASWVTNTVSSWWNPPPRPSTAAPTVAAPSSPAISITASLRVRAPSWPSVNERKAPSAPTRAKRYVFA